MYNYSLLQWCHPAPHQSVPHLPPEGSAWRGTPWWSPLQRCQRSWNMFFNIFISAPFTYTVDWIFCSIFFKLIYLNACMSSSYVRSNSMSSSRSESFWGSPGFRLSLIICELAKVRYKTYTMECLLHNHMLALLKFFPLPLWSNCHPQHKNK